MAKKANNDTTTWISLSDARALVISAYGATQLAETLLKKWLGEKRVRWTCKLFEPAPVSDLVAFQGALFVANVAYSNGDPAFWRADLEINWVESWAREKYTHGGARATTITVVREEVLAQLPAELDAPPRQHLSAKSLIEAEVKRRAEANERWDSITELSKDIHKGMKTDKPLAARTIENYLRKGKLFFLLFQKK